MQMATLTNHGASVDGTLNDGTPPSTLYQAKLFKTKFCRFVRLGRCRHGAMCPFAHHEDELLQQPDLLKTSLCRDWLRGECQRGDCAFAHGEHELREMPPSTRKSATSEHRGNMQTMHSAVPMGRPQDQRTDMQPLQPALQSGFQSQPTQRDIQSRPQHQRDNQNQPIQRDNQNQPKVMYEEVQGQISNLQGQIAALQALCGAPHTGGERGGWTEAENNRQPAGNVLSANIGDSQCMPFANGADRSTFIFGDNGTSPGPLRQCETAAPPPPPMGYMGQSSDVCKQPGIVLPRDAIVPPAAMGNMGACRGQDQEQSSDMGQATPCYAVQAPTPLPQCNSNVMIAVIAPGQFPLFLSSQNTNATPITGLPNSVTKCMHAAGMERQAAWDPNAGLGNLVTKSSPTSGMDNSPAVWPAIPPAAERNMHPFDLEALLQNAMPEVYED